MTDINHTSQVILQPEPPYARRRSTVARVGQTAIGGDNPIRVQSMTTTDTNDTEACVAQAKRIIEAGGELVRLTTQGTQIGRAHV